MDFSSSSLQLQNTGSFLFNCKKLLDQSFSVSDPGYYSAGGSLSPTSSIDSCSFSPPAYSFGAGQDTPQAVPLDSISIQEHKKVQPKRTGRPRSKFPGVKRQTASEREKLRMRDLTKALLHLRTYLPASVAPAGKTLTKIETLRLTIQYISCLTTQLAEGQSNPWSQAEVVFDSADPSVPQSLSARQCQSGPCYQTQNPVEFLPLPAQDFWFPQQQSFYPGQC